MFKFILIRIINRLLRTQGRVKLERKENKKAALVSYVLVPKIFIPFYFKSSHNNKYQCYLLIRFLFNNGFNVYLHDYLDDTTVDYGKEYDVFVGHNISFSKIGKRLKGSCEKILLATGSEPNFGNKQQQLRIAELNRRRNVLLPLYDDNIVPDLSENYQTADKILLMGNDFVRCTYPENIHHKIHLIDNVTLHPFFTRKTTFRKNNFLFISSIGQVHRGLDLLLEIFPRLPASLYLLSAFKDEAEFVKVFQNELYSQKNIIPVGFVSLESREFQAAVNECDFVILPSCAEGQSSSIINLMAYGLIPVIPENVGIPNIEQIGIKIHSLDPEGVEKAVLSAMSMSDADFETRKKMIQSENLRYKEFSTNLSILLPTDTSAFTETPVRE